MKDGLMIVAYCALRHRCLLTFEVTNGGRIEDEVNMSSGFVKEADLEEARKKRQEEWDKVRKPDEPEVAPEEPYDHRSLFER